MNERNMMLKAMGYPILRQPRQWRLTSQVGDRGAARLAAALERNEVAELEMGIERWEKETWGE